MKNDNQIKVVRDGLRRFNRRAGVLKTEPYGIGLSLSQSSALIDIGRFEKLRANDLVKLLHLEKSSVSRLIAVLEKQNFIQIHEDPEDGRSKILKLTKSGERVVEKINQISTYSVEEVFQKLSMKDRQGIALAFEKLAQAVEHIEASEN